MTLNNSELINFYKIFFRIRKTEEKISKEYHLGEIRCPVHLSIGQETVSVAFSMTQQLSDIAISTHRAHAHYLAKGGNLNKMIAEIYGKVTGCSKGIGGSMHLMDLNVNFMGSSAIVGNSIPVGVGLGLSAKLKKKNQISYVFFGEGATEQGVFYESVNFAIIKKLPVIFICENNLYSVYSDLKYRQPKTRKIYKLVKSFGIQAYKCNGNNVLDSYNTLIKARNFLLKKKQPVFIEFSTYRWLEHCGPNYDNDLKYRSEDEFNNWKKKDPIKILKQYLKKNFSHEKIEKKIKNEINNAFNFALKSKFPSKISEEDVYAKK
jgi:TPP-dependent pyruvate/acetoin dehydrogenase alpha subunit